MDNSQFRKLVNQGSKTDRSVSTTGNSSSNATSTAPLLGSRQRSAIPMTPRSVAGGYNPTSDFARQAAAYRALQNPTKEKKFRTSAPLGSKLPEGYVDRTKLRDENENQGDAEDRSKRMAALMQMVEDGSMTREEAIEQSKHFGGDVGGTHLVKGLDLKLLERARRGEDLLGGKGSDSSKKVEATEEDIEDELDKALEKDVGVVTKKKRKDENDDDDEVIPKKKTRAEILAELKKARAEAAAAAAQPSLGSKFKKFAERKVKPSKEGKSSKANIAQDASSGKKRKRDFDSGGISKKDEEIINGTVLGMLPPELPSAIVLTNPEAFVEDDDGNIFDDAPDEYDPLADLSDDDSGSEAGEIPEDTGKEKKEESKGNGAEDMPPPPSIPKTRNYFSTPSSGKNEESTESIASKPLTAQEFISTAQLSAAIEKASKMQELQKVNLDSEEAKKEAKHKAMLESMYRDDEDVDMGFGGSRTFGDEDEEEMVPGKKKSKKKKKT